MERNTDGEVLIYLLHTDCGASDQEIARNCQVSRVHINRVKHGRAGASNELVARLKWLYGQFENMPAQRKPYTWKAGKDIRGKQARAAQVARKQQRPGERTREYKPVEISSERPGLPRKPFYPIVQTFTGVEDFS